MKRQQILAPVAHILQHPQKDWRQITAFSRGNIRVAYRELDVDWKKFNQQDFLFAHVTILASCKVEDNGYRIVEPCDELVNANGNAWTNEVIQHCYKTFIGGQVFCFTQNNRVLMADGTYKPINEVKIGEYVINAKGQPDKVTNVYIHSSNKLMNIESKFFMNKKITCTTNHPFGVYKDRGTCLVTGKPLNPQRKKERPVYNDPGYAPGHFVKDSEVSRWGQPQFVNAEDLDQLKTLLYHPISNVVVENSQINENRAFLMGWFLSEGSYSWNKKGVSFSLNINEYEQACKIKELLEMQFPEVNMKGYNESKNKQLYNINNKDKLIKAHIRKILNPKTKRECGLSIYYHSQKASEFFMKWCGQYSWGKQMPEEAMFLPIELQKIILLRTIEGDGCYKQKERGAVIQLRSKKLIQQLRFIATRLGTFPIYRETKVLKKYSKKQMRQGYPVYIDENTGKMVRPGYMLSFNSYDWKKLVPERQVKHGAITTIFQNKNYVFRYDNIQFLKDIEEQTVYNLQVQKDHTYIVQGCVVHNCNHLQIPALSKGKILDAVLRPVNYKGKNGKEADVWYCDLLTATSRKHEDLIEKIESGKLTTLSMGTVASKCTCSICGKIIGDDDKNCKHLENHLGQYVEVDGKPYKCAELIGAIDPKTGEYIPDSCHFIEASWVDHPAFAGAVVNELLNSQQEIRVSKEKERQAELDALTEDMFMSLRVADKQSQMALNIAKEEYLVRKMALNILK